MAPGMLFRSPPPLPPCESKKGLESGVKGSRAYTGWAAFHVDCDDEFDDCECPSVAHVVLVFEGTLYAHGELAREGGLATMLDVLKLTPRDELETSNELSPSKMSERSLAQGAFTGVPWTNPRPTCGGPRWPGPRAVWMYRFAGGVLRTNFCPERLDTLTAITLSSSRAFGGWIGTRKDSLGAMGGGDEK